MKDNGTHKLKLKGKTCSPLKIIYHLLKEGAFQGIIMTIRSLKLEFKNPFMMFTTF